MILNLKHTVLAIAAASTLGVATQATAAPVTLRLSTAAPEKTIWGTQMGRFAADVLEASKGDVKVEVFYSSQLGSEQDVTQQVIRGRVDMTLVSNAGLASQIPEVMVTALYSFYDEADRNCILDEHMTKPTRELLDAKSLHFIGWFESGSGGLGSKRKMTSPADVKNVKLALSSNKFAIDYWKLFGAVPVATPAAEFASSIGTGLTDATPMQPTFYVAAGISKVAPVYNKNVPLAVQPGMLVMNKGIHDKLTPEQRDAIVAAASKVPARKIRAELAAFEGVMLKKHLEAGGQVFEPTPEELAEWKKPLDGFYDGLMKEMGPTAVAHYAKAKAAKVACKKK